MRVVPLDGYWIGLEKDINPLQVFDFLILLLNICKKNFKVLSRYMQKWIQPSACFDHGLHRILSSYWLAHFYLKKKSAQCCSILDWVVECWNSVLTSRNPKNNLCPSRIFGARFGGKDPGLSTCKPWSKQAGICMKRLKTLNSYQIPTV